MTRPVLITRPRNRVESLAHSLKGRDIPFIIAPMMTLAPVPCAVPDPRACDALVFTSQSGVEYFTVPPAAQADFHAKPVYAVGTATAAAARAAGYRDVRAAAGDLRRLNALLADRKKAGALPDGGRILHVAGDIVAGDVVVPGCAVERTVVYRAAPVPALSPECLSCFETPGFRAVLFFSPRTADIFADRVESAGLAGALGATKALCIADSVVKSLSGLRWQDVRVAATPDMNAMVALLDEQVQEHL